MTIRRFGDRMHRIADRISLFTSRLSVDSVIRDTERSIEQLERTGEALLRRSARQHQKVERYALLRDEDSNNAARAARVAARLRAIVS